MGNPGDSILLMLGALVLPLLFTLFAGTVHGLLGLGFPLVVTPLLALITDVRQAILLTLLPTLLVNVLTLLATKEWSALRAHWLILVGIVPGAWLGAELLVSVDANPFRLVLAAMIILHLWPKPPGHGAVHHSWVDLLVGVVAGLAAGTVNVMVPVLVLYLTTMQLPVMAMVVLFNLSFLTGKLVQIHVFVGHDILTTSLMAQTLPLMMAAALGVWIGLWMRRYVSEQRFTLAIRGVLMIMSILLVGQYVQHVR
ncbi:sulfite exporter TauE/SafE family protein [Magnetococcus sp. PR-3]|uniref:sulfite exporter TauE/SafE family protein n=1 Tax=Magnetococcus sp. PR-3 TaxID=3120355 RepID=UPI002FCE1365